MIKIAVYSLLITLGTIGLGLVVSCAPTTPDPAITALGLPPSTSTAVSATLTDAEQAAITGLLAGESGNQLLGDVGVAVVGDMAAQALGSKGKVIVSATGKTVLADVLAKDKSSKVLSDAARTALYKLLAASLPEPASTPAVP